MSIKKHSIDLLSNDSTQCDSCQDIDDQQNLFQQKTNPLKYKTEMCKRFSTIGYCNYGDKCKFAHGFNQLVRLPTSSHFRKKNCSKFWANGVCPYGLRCQFGHTQVEQETKIYLQAIQSIYRQSKGKESSRLSKVLSN